MVDQCGFIHIIICCRVDILVIIWNNPIHLICFTQLIYNISNVFITKIKISHILFTLTSYEYHLMWQNLNFSSKANWYFIVFSSFCNFSSTTIGQNGPTDTDELLKNEEIEPTIQQPSNKRKKKYLGRINYKVRHNSKMQHF